jgi:hypothetical protein
MREETTNHVMGIAVRLQRTQSDCGPIVDIGMTTLLSSEWHISYIARTLKGLRSQPMWRATSLEVGKTKNCP